VYQYKAPAYWLRCDCKVRSNIAWPVQQWCSQDRRPGVGN